MRKALIYSRVSTDDQSNARQVSELTAKASHYGMKIIGTFSDKISGSKGFMHREGGSSLLRHISQNPEITDIVVSEISRISRNVEDTKKVIRVLSEKGVNLHISNISMDTLDANGYPNPLVALVTSVLSGVAEYERELLRERTRSGMRHAKAQGKQIGREKTEASLEAERMFKLGNSVKAVMQKTGVSRSNAYKIKSKI